VASVARDGRLRLLAAISLSVGLPSACVVENNPPPPSPPYARRAPPPRPAPDAAVEASSDADAAGELDGAWDVAVSIPPLVPSGAANPSPGASLGSPFSACSSDGDCVAVRKNGCCNNGYKEAVNAASAAAYQASFVCPDPHPVCPMFRIHDTRLPECNVSRRQCEMVRAEEFECGMGTGLHACPPPLRCSAPSGSTDHGTCIR
jgi:hypothetical protein